MDELTHTVVATSLIAGAYYAEQFLKKRLMIESIIVSILETLEKEGFILTRKDRDGEKEIILINEIIAKVLHLL